MRKFLAHGSNCAGRSAAALLGLVVAASAAKHAAADPAEIEAALHAVPSPQICALETFVVYQPDASADSESACVRPLRTSGEITEARAYVVETANPGYTMNLQGAELAIGRLHPEFVVRLANAIREARNAGLTFAGVFSAYRPPAFGMGGFSDKFHSLHTYGLAVDMHGIGRPGSPEAQRWHEIAASYGIVCPYGPRNRAEWNHCQPTSLKIVLAANPLRETVTVDGPIDLDSMFEIGNAVIATMASAAESLTRVMPTPAKALEAAAKKIEPKPDVESQEESKPSVARASDESKRSPAKSAWARIVKAAAKKIEAKANLEGKEESKRSLAKATSARAVKAAKKIEVAKADLERKEGAGRASKVASARTAGKSLRRSRETRDARLRLRKTPVIAVEEGRRRSKVPAVDVSPRVASRSS